MDDRTLVDFLNAPMPYPREIDRAVAEGRITQQEAEQIVSAAFQRAGKELIRLQRKYNEWLRDATPEERARAAVAALRKMPGQAYLFEDAEEGAE